MRPSRAAALTLVLALLVGAAPVPPARGQDVEAPAEREVVVRFPDLHHARAAMSEDDGDAYISTLRTAEMTAKTGAPITGDDLEAQREECRRRYAAGTLQFDDEEKDHLQWLCREVTTKLLADYPLLADLPWSFVKVRSSIEGGLPHTRGAHIVLTAGVVRRIAMLREMDEKRALVGVGELLVHEQLHVAERRHPEVFAKLFTEEWGFEHVESLPSCAWLEEHQVVNPDGTDIRWVRSFRRGDETIHVHPRVIFSDGDGPKRMPWDFRFVGILLEKTDDGYALRLDDDGVPEHVPLLSIPEYRALFPGLSNVYHPNEALASMFPRMVLRDHLGRPSDADDALRTWCRESFARR